jgi:hypothetical protein
MERIRAVILNEGITMQRVVYYMAFVVEGEKNLVVAFKVHTTTQQTEKQIDYKHAPMAPSRLFNPISMLLGSRSRCTIHVMEWV